MNSEDSITPVFLIVLFIVLPLLSLRLHYRLRSGAPLPPKKNRYWSSVLALLTVGTFAFLSDLRQELVLFGRTPSFAQCAAGGGLLVAGCGLQLKRTWHRLPERDKQRLRQLLPENVSELRYWALLSVMAGTVEEYAYRGVAYSALVTISKSVIAAVIVCSFTFGAAHIYQGWKSVLIATILGMVLQALVLWTGALYLSIVVHALYDLQIGIVAARMFRSDTSPQVTIAESSHV